MWKLEPSTLKVVELAIPNPYPRPQVPTTFAALELVLQKDGSFVAKNVPAGFFFENWPAIAECGGLWSVKTNGMPLPPATGAGTTNSAVFSGGNTTNEHFQVELSFNNPALAVWSRPVSRLPDRTSSLAAGVGPWKDETRTYEWSISLVRQPAQEKAVKARERSEAK